MKKLFIVFLCMMTVAIPNKAYSEEEQHKEAFASDSNRDIFLHSGTLTALSSGASFGLAGLASLALDNPTNLILAGAGLMTATGMSLCALSFRNMYIKNKSPKKSKFDKR